MFEDTRCPVDYPVDSPLSGLERAHGQLRGYQDMVGGLTAQNTGASTEGPSKVLT